MTSTNPISICDMGSSIPFTNMHRVLIKTHHMTSRKKILALTTAAKSLDVSVVIRTGGPPGIMICEGGEGETMEWLGVVKVCILLSFSRVACRKLIKIL